MKNHKIKFFYPVASGAKPNATTKRHFIHSVPSAGFWAEIRDLSRSEIAANDAAGRKVSIYARVGYNSVILKRYPELIAVDEAGNTYRIKEKPDEFAYNKEDMRVSLHRFEDTTVYAGDEYD